MSHVWVLMLPGMLRPAWVMAVSDREVTGRLGLGIRVLNGFPYLSAHRDLEAPEIPSPLGLERMKLSPTVGQTWLRSCSV